MNDEVVPETKEVDENEETASDVIEKVEENNEKEKEEEETSTLSKIEKFDEEIKEHYVANKDKIGDLGVQIEDKEDVIFTMLETQKSDLDKMKIKKPETEEGEIVEVMDPRRRANSMDGELHVIKVILIK